jgi:hypothetical protein
MLQPLLLIGIGGSGGKTLRAIKLELQQRLVETGTCKEIPGAWQFLHIDSVSNQDGISFPAPMLTSEEFQTVAPQGITIREAMKFVSGSGSINDAQSLLAGWGPDASPIIINTSPSGERAAGRVFGLAQMERIHQAIKHSLSKALGPDSSKELEKFAGSKAELEITNLPKVIIFTSSGGSTGSGLLIDVQEILRRIVPDVWSQGLVTFLYSEEVFQGVPRGMLLNFTMNSFGLFNELSARSNGVFTERSESTYAGLGLAPNHGNLNRIGIIENNILIGGNNEGMDSCIYSFGADIAAAIFDDKILEFSELNSRLQYGAENVKIDRNAAQGLIVEDDLNYNSKQPTQTSLWKSPLLNRPLGALISQYKISPASKPEAVKERKVLGSFDHYVVLKNETPIAQSPHFESQKWAILTGGRRTRPIEESIPLSNEMRRSMITGWFIATMFGLRDIEFTDSRRIVKIWNTSLSEHGWSYFPDPLISGRNGDMKIESWVLPQLMLSLGFVLSESAVSGKQDSTHGYRFLKYLGREVTTSIPNRDEWDEKGQGDLLPTGLREKSTLVSDWVNTGEVPSREKELHQLLLSELNSFPTRGEALISSIRRLQGQYDRMWAEAESVVWYKLPETWELRADINSALQDIIEFVSECK